MTLARAAAALRPALRVVLIAAAGLGITAGAVLGLHDGHLFTSPPESVAEEFVQKLATRRWGPARDHFTPELAAAIDEAHLRDAVLAFERRWGRMEQVEGRPGADSADQAWAGALVTTSRGARLVLPFPLVRRSGVWRVAGLEGLTAVR